MSDLRYLLIVNPAARHGETAALVPVVERLLASVPHETVLTEAVGHATRIAQDARGFDAVVAVGGDGTVHEVLNGLMRRREDDRPTLGVIPTGSGNDTRRTLGISTDLSESVMQLVSGRTRRFDVGCCNGIFFNNSFSVGLDARVTVKAVELKETTRRSGLFLYLSALMHVLFHELYPCDLRISFDGGAASDEHLLMLAVTNGPTYGGGFFICPDAVPDDGVFDTCRIAPLGLVEALWRLPFVIAGKHTRMRPVTMARHASLVVESADPMPAGIDGEVLMDTRFEVSMLAGGIACVVPPETAAS